MGDVYLHIRTVFDLRLFYDDASVALGRIF